MRERTDHEKFWAGDFGSSYIRRNRGDELLAANLAFFSKALAKAPPPQSCLELGANIGMNLRALKLLYPEQAQFAVEINAEAVKELKQAIPAENVFCESILDFEPAASFDLVLVKGVLIHLDPDSLSQVYETIYRAAGRHVLLCEYYNPTPIEVPYRGHSGRLFKRDFCGEIMDSFSELRLVDYGFAYHRDNSFPQDDISWFLLEKRD